MIAESAFNDPTGAVLALTVAGVLLTGEDSVTAPVADFVAELAISAVIGILAGVVLSAAISSRRTGIWRESSAIAVLTVVSIAYVSLDSAGGSGYLGAFLAGLIVGNMDLLRLDMHPGARAGHARVHVERRRRRHPVRVPRPRREPAARHAVGSTSSPPWPSWPS